MTTEPTVKRLKQGKVECTVTFSEAEVAPAEKAALEALGQTVKVEGFRPGNVPPDMVKEKVDKGALMEETIRNLLPGAFDKLTSENDIQPVMPPKVEAVSEFPLTLKITFIEKPEVKLKGVDKIKVEKKEVKVDEKDVQKMIDYILQQHQRTAQVDRAAKETDRVTMDFWGEGEDKKEIEGTRMKDYQTVIGSNTLIPGFEDALVGLKKGEKKSFELVFPEKYHAEHLQNKPVTFHVTVSNVEEIDTPDLTDDFVKQQLNGESVAEFKKQIEESMRMQEEDIDRKRQEQELMDEIRKATTVDLPEELVDEETRALFEELAGQLEQQNIGIDVWLKQTGKKPEEVQAELKEKATNRLTLRLGMQQLVEDKGVDISDEEMTKIVQEFLAPAPADQRAELEAAYKPGQNAYEQFKWQKKVERVIEEMLS